MMNKILEKYLLENCVVKKDIDLSVYKAQLRKLKITHRQVAIYTGHTRETISLWLLGSKKPPIRMANHIANEIEKLIYVLKMEKKLARLNKENDKK